MNKPERIAPHYRINTTQQSADIKMFYKLSYPYDDAERHKEKNKFISSERLFKKKNSSRQTSKYI